MTSEFIFIKLMFNTLGVNDKGIKQWRTCFRLRACIKARSGYFVPKL